MDFRGLWMSGGKNWKLKICKFSIFKNFFKKKTKNSAMEAKFYRHKEPTHAHTNMAKVCFFILYLDLQKKM